MGKIDDLVEVLFRDREFAIICYGEDPEVNLMFKAMEERHTGSFRGTGLSLDQMIAASGGLCPVLIVDYHHPLPRDLAGPDLSEYLAGEAFKSEIEFKYNLYFVNAGGPLLDILIQRFKGRQVALFENENRRNVMCIDAKRGERVCVVFLAGSPIAEISQHA